MSVQNRFTITTVSSGLVNVVANDVPVSFDVPTNVKVVTNVVDGKNIIRQNFLNQVNTNLYLI
jgi:hypothetical protein